MNSACIFVGMFTFLLFFRPKITQVKLFELYSAIKIRSKNYILGIVDNLLLIKDFEKCKIMMTGLENIIKTIFIKGPLSDEEINNQFYELLKPENIKQNIIKLESYYDKILENNDNQNDERFYKGSDL